MTQGNLFRSVGDDGDHYVISDLEIKRCILGRGEQPDPNYEYCNGWGDRVGMGISVAAFINSHGSEAVYVWDSCRHHAHQHLVSRGGALTRITFNGKTFDDKVFQAHEFDWNTDYDLLEEVRLAAFGSTTRKGQPKTSSYKLEFIASCNGQAKTPGGGAAAPQIWQDYKRTGDRALLQQLKDYCLNDVRIAEAIMLLGWQGGLVDPNTGFCLKLRSIKEVRENHPGWMPTQTPGAQQAATGYLKPVIAKPILRKRSQF